MDSPQLAEDFATAAKPERKHVALVFADIVESTEMVARVGDVGWLNYGAARVAKQAEFD